jgi:hypothetical protein
LQITNVIPYNTVDLLKRSDKSEISGWAMPSNTFENLTLGASGSTYTAPANGWYFLIKITNAVNQFVNIYTSVLAVTSQPNISGAYIRLYIPVKKGETFTVSYNAGGNTELFRFVYAQGSESEAS